MQKPGGRVAWDDEGLIRLMIVTAGEAGTGTVILDHVETGWHGCLHIRDVNSQWLTPLDDEAAAVLSEAALGARLGTLASTRTTSSSRARSALHGHEPGSWGEGGAHGSQAGQARPPRRK